MKKLALHYERQRQRHPGHRLLILFDIDGTILDMRHMMLYVLRAYDARHGTRHFADLELEKIHVHENEVEALLERLGLDATERARVADWY